MRRQDYKHWQTGLPQESDALADLDEFCADMGGIERSEATRFILIAWSKARRGEFGQMWGFASAGNLPPVQVQAKVQNVPTLPARTAPPKAVSSSKAASNANASAASLDLDD